MFLLGPILDVLNVLESKMLRKKLFFSGQSWIVWRSWPVVERRAAVVETLRTSAGNVLLRLVLFILLFITSLIILLLITIIIIIMVDTSKTLAGNVWLRLPLHHPRIHHHHTRIHCHLDHPHPHQYNLHQFIIIVDTLKISTGNVWLRMASQSSSSSLSCWMMIILPDKGWEGSSCKEWGVKLGGTNNSWSSEISKIVFLCLFSMFSYVFLSM